MHLLSLLLAPALAQPTPTSGSVAPAADEAAPDDALPPLVVEPALITFADAPYPPEAEAQGLRGDVLLLIEIDATGAVTAVEVLQPAGHGFDEAATEAARQFKFSPAEDAEGPVPVAIEFVYGFAPDAKVVEPEPLPPDAPEALAPVNLEGELVEMGTRVPLEGVAMRVELPDGTTADAITGPDGRWAFRGLPPGEVTVVAAHPGYARVTEKVDVIDGQVTDIRLWIKNLGYRDNEVVAAYQKKRPPEVTRRTITVAEVKRIPGTFGDPVRVIQNLPGAARPPFGSGLLVVRGANPEDSAVYVDGLRVPIIYHLGGYVSVINADLIDSVDYLPGGYSTRYGRSLGGTIDVKTKDGPGEDDRLIWSTDLLDSGGLFEARLGKNDGLGLQVGARRSYIDAFIPIFTGDSGFTILPRWYDYQVKVSDLRQKDVTRSLFVFGYRDTLRVQTPADFAQGTDEDTQGDISTVYGAHAVLGKWEKSLNDDVQVSLMPAYKYEFTQFSLGNDFEFAVGQHLLGLRAELPWQVNPTLQLIPGVDAAVAWYDVDLKLPFSPDSFQSFDPLQEDEPYSDGFDGVAYTPDPFIDARITPLEDKDALLINPGVRLATFRLDGADLMLAADPRLQMRWRVVKRGFLKGGSGIYHQPPQGADFGFSEDSIDIDMEQVWSSELGWEHTLAEGLTADATVFHKEMTDLIVSNPAFDSGASDQPFANIGTGQVNGAEFMLRQSPVNQFFGWVSYTFSKSERDDDGDGGAEPYPFAFDQTHILTVVAGYDLPRDYGISGRFQYVTGNPYTPQLGGVYDMDQDSYASFAVGEPNSERMADYMALDLRADKLFTFKRWQLEMYIDALNVIHGENPESVQYNYDYTESTYVTGLPFIVSPGFEARVFF